MKFIWLLILLLFFITPNFVEAQNEENILFENTEYGFSINYPDGWIADSDSFFQTDETTNIITFLDGKFGEFHNRVDVAKIHSPLFPHSQPTQYLQFVETFVEISCVEMNKIDTVFQCGSIKILDSEILDLNGQNGYHVSYDWLQIEPDGYSQLVHSTLTYIPVKDQTWKIYSVTWPRDNIDHSRTDIYNIIHSFTITNSQENMEISPIQKFTKPHSDYSFEIPSGWQSFDLPIEIISEYVETKTNVIFIPPVYYGTTPPSITFQEFEIYFGTDFFKKTDEELLQQSTDIVVIIGENANSVVEIFDQKVEHFSESVKISTISKLTPKTGNGPVVISEFVQWEFQNDKSFQFTFFAETRDYDENISTFNSVLSSFEVDIVQPNLSDVVNVFFAFFGSLLCSIGLLIFYTKTNHPKTKFSKVGIILLIILILMVILGLYFDGLNFIDSRLVLLADLVKDAPIEVYSYAIIFGITAPLLSFQTFKFVNKTLDGFSSDLKFIIKIAIFFFFFAAIEVFITAFVFFFIGILGFLDLSIKSDVLIREHIATFVFTFDGLKVPITNIFSTLTLWIPLTFFVYFFKDIKKLKSKKRFAVVLFLASIMLYFVMGYFSSSTFSPLEKENSGMLSIVSGSIISAILIAFLSAEGYLDTIKEKIQRQ